MSEPSARIVGAGTEGEIFNGAENVALASAACLGDVQGIHAALGRHADVNARGRGEMRPVLWALHCGSLSGMEELLRAGADPIPSAVVDAAKVGDARFLRLLLKFGGDPNARDPDGVWTAVRIGFSMGLQDKGWDGYYALLDAGADVNRANVAEFAAELNQYDKVAELLERGYNSDLAYLGSLVEDVDEASMPSGQYAHAMRVMAMLEQRGVRFPTSETSGRANP